MLRATLKGLLSRKIRLVLSALAVVLGVMFVSGAFVLTDSLGKSFDNLFASISSTIDVQVKAKPPEGGPNTGEVVTAFIPESEVAKAAAVPGVAKATGSVFTAGARLVGKNGKVVQSFAPRYGYDWQGNDGLVELREGRGPQSDDEIVLDAALAKTSGYQVGDKAPVLTLQSKKSFTVVGIFGYVGGRDTLGGSQVIGFTLPAAQQLLLAKTGVYTEIDITAADGVDDSVLRDRVAAALGTGYQVRTAQEVSAANSANVKDGLKFVNYILLGFAAVALFVGVFLIINTFSMLVAQRTRELALLRAVGASRGQVIRSVLLEATLVGLIASVIGLAAGVGVGYLLAAVLGNLGGSNLDVAISVPPTAVISAVVVGLLVTLVAALAPALRASRVPPIAAMRDAATPDKPLTVITIVGGAVMAGAVTLMSLGLWFVDGSGGVWLLLSGVLVTFVGMALLTPMISRPIVPVLGLVFSWSAPGKLGRRNSSRNPRRTAITAAALMVGIALVTGISTILSSVTESIESSLDSQVKAQLIIGGQQTSEIPPTFDASVVTDAERIDGVRTVAAVWADAAKVDGRTSFLAAVNDPAAVVDVLGMRRKDGVIDRLADRQLLVDENTATDRGMTVGTAVTVQTSRGGPVQYTVTGIYQRNDSLSGFILPQSAAATFLLPQPTQALIRLNDGVSISAVKPQLERLVADSPEVTVQDQSEYIKQITDQFKNVLVIIQILLALAIIIAVLGIINTLALSVIERTRELGLLRAVGLGRWQTIRMITVESVVLSIFGALLGVAVGVGLGFLVFKALSDQGLKDFALPWTQMITYLVLGAVIGLVAAVLPAIRAVRLNVLEAISYE
jgi:putative ABC transport system permease protein